MRLMKFMLTFCLVIGLTSCGENTAKPASSNQNTVSAKSTGQLKKIPSDQAGEFIKSKLAVYAKLGRSLNQTQVDCLYAKLTGEFAVIAPHFNTSPKEIKNLLPKFEDLDKVCKSGFGQAAKVK